MSEEFSKNVDSDDFSEDQFVFIIVCSVSVCFESSQTCNTATSSNVKKKLFKTITGLVNNTQLISI